MARAAIQTSILRQMHPRNDNILILRDPTQKQIGKILLPDQAQCQQQLGTVIAVGPGKMLEIGERQGIDLAPADRVIFNVYAGTEFVTEDGSEDEYVLVQEKDVLSILPKD